MNKKITRMRPAAPPVPTAENPYVQLEWIWRRYMLRYNNKKTVEGLRARLAIYKEFLVQANGHDERLETDPRFYLVVHWDHFAIYNAEKYWRAIGYSSSSIHSYAKTLKSVMIFAAAEGLTSVSEFFYPQIAVTRETKRREAYTDKELNCVRQIITDDSLFASRVAGGYRPTGIGKDPRGLTYGITEDGWANWDNIVWYFENVMQCRAIRRPKPGTSYPGMPGIRQFFFSVSRYHGGIDAVWKRLGVSVVIGSNLVIPLAMKLAWETGLNPEAILNLKRDCYRKTHNLTGLPYIRYYKERSSGEKDLHLALFDAENQADLHLLPKQSEIIRRTFELILRLTAPLVADARPEDKDYLLLMQNRSCNKAEHIATSGIMRVNKGALQFWSAASRREFRKRTSATVTADKGNREDIPEVMNLARFRATKITQMVREGNDFFRVQAVAGHASVRTTARYLATHQLESQARREVAATLAQIHRNTKEQQERPKPYAVYPKIPQDAGAEVIYKGVICDCKNVFTPPKPVRSLSTFKEGDPCTYWNMCLFCPNVIITRRHLPLLINYAKDIKSSFKDGNLMQVPNAALYQKALAVIEGIFEEFPEEHLKWAENVAECGDFYADAVVYQGVKYE